MSSDNVAMVIHGSKLTDYAYYIGDQEAMAVNQSTSSSTNKSKKIKENFENDSNKTCESLSKDNIQRNFALKAFEINRSTAGCCEVEMESALKTCIKGLIDEPDLYQIPTLWQFLELVAEQNQANASKGLSTLKLNIELKGKNSGFITIATLHNFNNKQLSANKCTIDYADIILLGKMPIGEIRIVKNVINSATAVLNKPTASMEENDKIRLEHENLASLFGEKEHEIYSSHTGWTLYLSLNSNSTEEVLPENFADKAIVLTNQNRVFYVKNRKFFRKGSKDPKDFLVEFDEKTSKFIKEMFLEQQQQFCEIDKTPAIDDLIHNIKNQTNHIPSTFCDVPEEYQHGKIIERIAVYQYKEMLKIKLIEFRNMSAIKDLNQLIQYIIEQEYISYDSVLNYAEYQQNGKVATAIINYSNLKTTSQDDKNKTQRKQKSVISKEKLILLNAFLASINWTDMKKIRTNVMLSTGELYGDNALESDNEDFDVKPSISTVPPSGVILVKYCLDWGYDSIDISLFDTDEAIISVIIAAINEKSIMGVTASNWKGTQSENSSISPWRAIERAKLLSQILNIDILMKVDEPEIFKRFSNITLAGGGSILSTTTFTFMDATQSHVIEDKEFSSIPDELIDLVQQNFDVTRQGTVSPFIRSEKPPRGDVKKHKNNKSNQDIEQSAPLILFSHAMTNEGISHPIDTANNQPNANQTEKNITRYVSQ